MPKICEICEKGPLSGAKYKRRGMEKAKGGAGSKITGKMHRHFLPNLQRVKVNIGGTIRRILVCTRCIKGGRIVKA